MGSSRRLVLVVWAALSVAVLSGCGSGSSPVKSSPAPVFTSEADAFAAAEQTYRNYIDAVNRADVSDPRTFEDVYVWLTSDLRAMERKSFSQMHADRWTIVGDVVPALITPLSALDGFRSVTVAICVDVRNVEVRDPSGASMVADDRGDFQSIKGTLTRSEDTATGWIIEDLVGREGAPTCE